MVKTGFHPRELAASPGILILLREARLPNLKALSNPNRLPIVDALSHGERCVF
jgi:hypothetical protein